MHQAIGGRKKYQSKRQRLGILGLENLLDRVQSVFGIGTDVNDADESICGPGRLPYSFHHLSVQLVALCLCTEQLELAGGTKQGSKPQARFRNLAKCQKGADSWTKSYTNAHYDSQPGSPHLDYSINRDVQYDVRLQMQGMVILTGDTQNLTYGEESSCGNALLTFCKNGTDMGRESDRHDAGSV